MGVLIDAAGKSRIEKKFAKALLFHFLSSLTVTGWRVAERKAALLTSSFIWDPEIALRGALAKIQPMGKFSPAEGTLKHRMT
jgi:hypothetical protein